MYIHILHDPVYVLTRNAQSWPKACLRVCLRWLAYEQQKPGSSNNDTGESTVTRGSSKHNVTHDL